MKCLTSFNTVIPIVVSRPNPRVHFTSFSSASTKKANREKCIVYHVHDTYDFDICHNRREARIEIDKMPSIAYYTIHLFKDILSLKQHTSKLELEQG